MPRKLAYVLVAASLLAVGAMVSHFTSTREPSTSPVRVLVAQDAAADARSKSPLRRPPSALAELGVVTNQTAPLDRASLAEGLNETLCGDRAACEAVRATLLDERATSLRRASMADATDWKVGGETHGSTLWVVRVVTVPSRRQLALRTAFAAAGALAHQVDGQVVDRVLGRAEDAQTFASHAVTEPLDAPVFRADRVRLVEEPAGEDVVRLRTAGLGRWGAPDVEAAAVPAAALSATSDVLLGVAAALADTQDFASPVTLTRADIDAAAGRKAPGDGGPEAREGPNDESVDVDLVSIESDHPGPHDGADFIARIEPRGGEGPLGYLELAERFFGSVLAAPPDEVTQKGKHSRTARELGDALDRSSADGRAHVFVRLSFDIPGGGREWLWVEVTAHDARTITGRIADDPLAATDIERGQVVTRPRADVDGVRVR
ncbi:MAG: DUF2314 domain-containing protein [Polyangiaceae bacterium]|nr:DUF2314 domain-containing protein [Polyangiaceae bacterium]